MTTQPNGLKVQNIMRTLSLQYVQRFLLVTSIAILSFTSTSARCQSTNYEFNDSHFHLTNNTQEGPEIRQDRVTQVHIPMLQANRFPDAEAGPV
jgi:hypothetical protein